MTNGSFKQTLTCLIARLEGRRDEIEQALLARVYGIADPTAVGDPVYLEGFRAAATAAVDFAFNTLQSPEDRPPVVPAVLLSQACLAARHSVNLDTVLRRYTAGHALLVDFLIEEAEREGNTPPADLRQLLTLGSSSLDRLLAAVSEEYARERQARSTVSPDQRQAQRVRRLLAGELIDTSKLCYEFDGVHLALVARGAGARDAIRELARKLDRNLLKVAADHGVIWAWLGGRRQLPASRVACALSETWPSDAYLSLGEPAKGVFGWRHSHYQALKAFPVALKGSDRVVRYVEVGLLASALKDEILARSLLQIYVAPLNGERDGGEAFRETLKAYFAVDGNISSAAAILKASRQTVRTRLRAIENKIGRPIRECAAELDLALRLDALSASPADPSPSPA